MSACSKFLIIKFKPPQRALYNVCSISKLRPPTIFEQCSLVTGKQK